MPRIPQTPMVYRNKTPAGMVHHASLAKFKPYIRRNSMPTSAERPIVDSAVTDSCESPQARNGLDSLEVFRSPDGVLSPPVKSQKPCPSTGRDTVAEHFWAFAMHGWCYREPRILAWWPSRSFST